MTTLIRRADLARIAHVGMRAGHHLEQHGAIVWNTTRDWQTPLSASSGPGGKGSHSDPTGRAVINPDDLTGEHDELVAAVAAYEAAADRLYWALERNRPRTELEAEAIRARKPKLAYCLVCDVEVMQPRRGMCDKDYRRWMRLGQPANYVQEMRLEHQHETGVA